MSLVYDAIECHMTISNNETDARRYCRDNYPWLLDHFYWTLEFDKSQSISKLREIDAERWAFEGK